VGGLARRAGYIESVRKTERNVLLVDSGNVFLTPGLLPQLKAATAVEAMESMRYDALNLGHADFVFGPDFLLDACAQHGVPVMSANLSDNLTGSLIAQDQQLFSFKSFTAGVTGVVAQSYQKIITKYTEPFGQLFSVHNEFDALRERVLALRPRVDILIVLADTGLEGAKEIARSVSGIDVIVCSGGYEITEAPLYVKGVYIVKTGSRGEHIGRLTVTLDENRAIAGAEGEVIALDSAIPENDDVTGIIDAYHRGLRRYEDELLVIEQREPEAGWYYTGAVVCALCHVSQSGQWRHTGHPAAFDTLITKNQDYNPECIACHITGYGFTGGFELPETTPERGGVQCEMCHGPGGEHAETLAVPYGETSRDVCITCHTQDHSPDFDYDVYIEKVKH